MRGPTCPAFCCANTVMVVMMFPLFVANRMCSMHFSKTPWRLLVGLSIESPSALLFFLLRHRSSHLCFRFLPLRWSRFCNQWSPCDSTGCGWCTCYIQNKQKAKQTNENENKNKKKNKNKNKSKSKNKNKNENENKNKNKNTNKKQKKT